MRLVTLAPDELDAVTAYQLWRLRQDVFVIEQQCLFRDLDGRDLEPATRHVLLLGDDGVRGAARVVDEGAARRIGRVVLHPSARGFGEQLVEAALATAAGRDVLLDALAPLEGWYAAFGFEVCGPAYVEDEMPHVPMRLARDSPAGR